VASVYGLFSNCGRQLLRWLSGHLWVTFTLGGFKTGLWENIKAVNANMEVGALEETITVTGETPVVDVQSTTS